MQLAASSHQPALKCSVDINDVLGTAGHIVLLHTVEAQAFR